MAYADIVAEKGTADNEGGLAWVLANIARSPVSFDNSG